MKKYPEANKIITFATEYNTQRYGIIFSRKSNDFRKTTYKKPNAEEELKLYAAPCSPARQRN